MSTFLQPSAVVQFSRVLEAQQFSKTKINSCMRILLFWKIWLLVWFVSTRFLFVEWSSKRISAFCKDHTVNEFVPTKKFVSKKCGKFQLHWPWFCPFASLIPSPKFQLHNSTTLFRTDVKDRRGRRITLNPSSWTGKWFYSSDLLALSFVLRSSVLAIRSTQDLTRSLQQESHTRNNDRMQFVKRDSFRRVHTEGQ